MKYRYGIMAAALLAVSANAVPFCAYANEVEIDNKDTEADDIVIKEAEAGLFEEGRMLVLQIEKIDTNGDVTCYVEKGDIEVSAELTDKDGLLGMFKDKPNYSDVKKSASDDCSYLVITVEDESTEASEIVVSGIKLYLDRTMPNGSYALKNVYSDSGLWENTSTDKDEYDKNGVFNMSLWLWTPNMYRL